MDDRKLPAMDLEKTEFFVFGSRPQLEKLSLDKIEVCSSIIKNLNIIKLVGAISG